MLFDFGELFTEAVRQVVPLAQRRRMPVAFDCRPPAVTLQTDPDAVHQALQRLFEGAIAAMDVGFLLIDAVPRLLRPGRCALTIKAGGAGLMAGAATVDRVLQDLWLAPMPMEGDVGQAHLRRALGRCPHTGADIEFSAVPGHGMLLSFEWRHVRYELPGTVAVEGAHGATAWLVHHDGVAAEALARRLKRLGWQASRLESVETAERRLRGLGPAQAKPALVVVSDAAAAGASLVQLHRLLPAAVQRVRLHTAGAPMPAGAADFAPIFDPPSPGDLRELTGRCCRPAAAPHVLAQWPWLQRGPAPRSRPPE